MKKNILTISIILATIFSLVSVIFFFLMKNSEPNDSVSESVEEGEFRYDTSIVIDKIKFLKFNDYDAIKQYADDYPIFIQESNEKTIFSVGELYIKEKPAKLIYKLNSDGSINRFDGSYSMELADKSVTGLQDTFWLFSAIVCDYFYVEQFEHDFYDENGAPIYTDSEESYELMFNGKATYGLSVIDLDGTYWYITASVSDKKQIDFEFLRCFDLTVYNDYSPNIDMRELEGAESGYDEEQSKE